jgi:hypothetical protein
MLCDTNGTPLCFPLSVSQASDTSYAHSLLDEVSIPSSHRGRLRKRCEWLLAGKASRYSVIEVSLSSPCAQ